MRILIIEDELPAQAKLEEMLRQLEPKAQVVARIGSVKESLQWLASNLPPDLAFVDIQLSDDSSFEIFRNHRVEFPVIFTTAYDKYILESFEFNSIDYLLKPITLEKLGRSLSKVRQLENHFVRWNVDKILEVMKGKPEGRRIVAKKGTEFIALEYSSIAYFFTEHRLVFVRDFEGRQFIVDENLGELEGKLDRKTFFRLNRKFIANIAAIERFKPDNGKILVTLKPEVKEEIHVSKETAPEFRTWIGLTSFTS
jgi:DNA-binding LytR/AlgR family response regulator